MATNTQSAVMMFGKHVAKQMEERIAAAVPDFVARHQVVPTLAIVQVGRNPASERYIRKKIESCGRLGMHADLHQFDESITADDLKREVELLSRRTEIHGLLVQLPLPRAIEEPAAGGTSKFDIFDAIAAEKDVDGIGRESIPELYRAEQHRMRFLPGTALAVRRMIAYYKIETEGRRAVVVGRNDITAKPILHMLGGRMCNAAAIWCHRYVPPKDQQELIRSADILVTSVGSPHFQITREMLKPGVDIFDIATRIGADGKIRGDVDAEAGAQLAAHFTPVPGGVGPVTVAALAENLFRAARFAVGAGEMGYSF